MSTQHQLDLLELEELTDKKEILLFKLKQFEYDTQVKIDFLTEQTGNLQQRVAKIEALEFEEKMEAKRVSREIKRIDLDIEYIKTCIEIFHEKDPEFLIEN